MGRHGRDEWMPPVRGTMMWQSTCHRCGCRMARDPLSGRWRPEERPKVRPERLLKAS